MKRGGRYTARKRVKVLQGFAMKTNNVNPIEKIILIFNKHKIAQENEFIGSNLG